MHEHDSRTTLCILETVSLQQVNRKSWRTMFGPYRTSQQRKQEQPYRHRRQTNGRRYRDCKHTDCSVLLLAPKRYSSVDYQVQVMHHCLPILGFRSTQFQNSGLIFHTDDRLRNGNSLFSRGCRSANIISSSRLDCCFFALAVGVFLFRRGV